MDKEIWGAITELYFLLKQRHLLEKAYQEFFERNPSVFRILGFDCYASFEIESGNRLPYDKERRFTPMPDFICCRYDTEEIIVFEIKRSDETRAITTRSDGNRAKLRANIESYISQTCEYIKSIRSNSDSREIISKILGINRIRSISGLLVCGISHDCDAPVVAELISEREPRIEYIYYDKIYERLCDAHVLGRKQYIKLENNYTGVEGVHLTVVASVSDKQKYEHAYLIDIGELQQNRVSIFISDAAYIRILDANGLPLQVKLDIIFGVPQIFQIEFSNDPVHGFISIFHNNEEILNIQRQDGYENFLSMNNMVIGANCEGKYGACFLLGSAILRYKTLGIDEKLELLGHLIDQCDTGYGLEYSGAQYLRRNSDGNLVAESDDGRPIFRESLHYERLKE